MYEDYFDIKLNDGRNFRWKNFGQVVTIDGEDIRKKPVNISGAIINREKFKDIEVLQDYQWFINANIFSGNEPAEIILRLPSDEIYIVINNIFDTRLVQYPELDYYDAINLKFYNDFVKRIGDEDKAFTYLTNWRRPKLKTNGEVKIIIYHNGDTLYVGMLDAEKKKAVIDAFYRMIYYTQFLSGEADV